MGHYDKKSRLASPYVWSFTTYFTEGFPYTIIRTISSLFLRDMGVRLESIGLTSLYGLPWILKFLWGPHVDRFGTKRSWMLVMQFLLTVMMLSAAVFAPLSWGVSAIAVLFFVGAFFAATHDTAIDGYYMEGLDADGQARFVGYRVMAYRIAMIAGTGLVATLGTTRGWFLGFLSAALLFGLFFVYHIFFLPRVERKGRPCGQLFRSFARARVLLGTAFLAALVIGVRMLYESGFYAGLRERVPALRKVWFSHWVGILLLLALAAAILGRSRIKKLIERDPESFYSRAFLTFVDREKIGAIFAAIILLRTGEFALASMVAPFFVDLGIKVHYGWISSGVGLPCSIIGALVGGRMISRFTLRRVIWPFLLLQNLTNLAYMALALGLASYVGLNTGAKVVQPVGQLNLVWVACVHAFDQFAGGLGTAVLMTFLMRICRKEFKAAHYAIGTGFMNVSGVFVGVLGGFMCSWLGYGPFFGISFLLSLPGMAAVMFLPDFVFSSERKAHGRSA